MKTPHPEEAVQKLVAGDRIILSRLISLSESPLTEHRKLIASVLELAGEQGTDSRRIGITGVPGAGKSTFINIFGSHICDLGKKTAVLAIDPTSSRSGGSILGDKTRMAELAGRENAFIRPSPTSGYLGGVNAGTRTAIRLCEIAGFTHILVETVGVGQSETAVENLVDCLLLIMIPGSGDELQGIKRGIMETADAIIINKADGDAKNLAQQAKTQYQSAIHLFPPHPSGWPVPVLTCSAIENSGINEVYKTCEKFFETSVSSGYFEEHRSRQKLKALHEILREMLMHQILSSDAVRQSILEAEISVQSGKGDPVAAASRIAEKFKTVF